jgi:hypothetical protein
MSRADAGGRSVLVLNLELVDASESMASLDPLLNAAM